MRIGIDASVIDKYLGLGKVCMNLIKGIASIVKNEDFLYVDEQEGFAGKRPQINQYRSTMK